MLCSLWVCMCLHLRELPLVTQAQAVLSHALCGAPVTGAGCVCVSYQLPLAATPRFSILTE